MKGYDNYRDVNKVDGMDWMPKIPAHWEQKKLKFLAEIKLGKMLTPDNPGDYFQKPYLRAQNVAWMTANLADVKEMWFSAKELELLRLRVDDLIISEGGEVGRTAIWKGELDECYIQNSVHKLTCKEDAYPRYMLYMFSLYGHVGYFDSIVNRISLAHLTGEKLKEVTAIVPPLAEQRAIAQFLDAKTAQLDQLIAQKQQMLALLREERAALINHAVTKGLDAGAPLRDSGIDWLGEVPAHWEVKRLKYVAELVNRKVSPSEAEQTLSLENIESWTGRLILLDSQQELESDLQSFQPDDVLFCKLRPYLAKVHLATNNGACVGELLVLRHQEDITPGFLYNRLLSEAFITIVNSSTYGSKMPRASWDFISQLRIPVPPIHEQDEIVKHINSKCEEIEGAVDTINQEIALLQEYRAALIAEAVTGQIDVRHYEPALEAVFM